MKISKCLRFLSVLVCCCCLLFWCVAAPASAVAGVDDLIIGGTAVMTLGLVTAFTMISMSAAGMTPSLQAAAQAAQQDVKEFAGTLFHSYAKSQNITAGQAVQIAQQGTSYLDDGRIIFNDKMSELMSGFLNWAWDADGGNLIASAPVVTPSGSVLDYSDVDTSVLAYPNFNYIIYPYYCDSTFSVTDTKHNVVDNFSFSSPVYFIKYQNSTTFLAVSQVPFSVSRDRYSTSWSSSTYTSDGITYYFTSFTQNFSYDYTIPVYTISTVASAGTNRGCWDIAYLIFNGVISGDPVYDVNLDVLKDVGNGSVGVFDPDSVVSIPDAPVAGGTIAIDDWLNALADSIAVGVASIPIAIDNATTVDVAMELAAEDAMPLEVTADPPAGGDQIADSSDVSTLDPYTLDLTDFFPFCIPFDIYDMLSAFSADRHAPRFDYRFYIPNLCDETITIDLSAFDGVASVLRTVELVAFAIGLAFVTKKLIQGGD